jgi:hypothetical protein
MSILTIAYWCSVSIAGLYMLGIGYELIPDPGKKGSLKNKEHFDKYRKLFKRGGIATVIYLVLSLVSTLLAA